MPIGLRGFEVRLALGVAALFSGVALLGAIILGLSLPLGLAVLGLVLATIAGLVLRRADREQRSLLLRAAAAGAIAGLVATIVYDLTRFGLSQLDRSAYDPLEAIRAFGILLLGADAGGTAIHVAGSALHALNGTAFGVAFVVLFGADGRLSWQAMLLRGIAWGLFLESFQIALYPGWLDIRAFAEFATISAAGHLVYGAVLGLLGRALLRRMVYDPYAL